MNTIWIEHHGLQVIIDPKEGYEAIRGHSRSMIVLYPDRRQPILVKVRRDTTGRSFAPPDSRLMVSGFVHDYYVVYVLANDRRKAQRHV